MNKKTACKLLILLFILLTLNVSAQAINLSLNQHYRFPFSLGVEFQRLTPFADYGAAYFIYDVGINARLPLPPLPVLQLTAQGGVISFDNQNPLEPQEQDKLDNYHFYGGLGAVYAHRMAKNFEIGGELTGGYAQSYFPHLDENGETRGGGNLYIQAGGRISLNPSYNFLIDFHPNLRYLYSLDPFMHWHDGLILGLGMSVHFRFGEDPDSPRPIIRNLRFTSRPFPPVFAAMQSFYVKKPLAYVTITNIEKYALEEVEISFFQPDFMDTPTHSLTIPELAGGESQEVPLLVSFNRKVFTTEGVTPLGAEIIVTYTSRGKPAEQKLPVTFDLHDKTALIWDDARKAGAFITPADSALRNYSSHIHQVFKENTENVTSESVRFAIQVFYALSEIGILYQTDPNNPFMKVQGNTGIIDSVSLPRDTLKHLTGDCDDLTVLFCSLLESVGIRTAFITTPGHIFMAFDTGIEGIAYNSIHPDRRMTIGFDGTLWVPVEVTMIGTGTFLEAWKKGSEEYSGSDPGQRNFITTEEAQDLYRPVGLIESDLGLQYGNDRNMKKNYERDISALLNVIK